MAAGAFLAIAGFAYDAAFAGLPYQDPTPEMQANWRFHRWISESIILAGVVMLLAGVLSQAARWIISAMGR